MTEVSTPDVRADENELADEVRKDYSDADRKKMAKSGQALPDGSYPIADVQDLKNAIQAIGRAKNPAAAKAHIIKRARALGATNLLPDGWTKQSNSTVPVGRRGGRRKERHRSTPLGQEVRFFETGRLEVREADQSGDLVTITGTPIVYDTWYSVTDMLGEFQERMAAGVATDVINTDVRFLFNHGGMPLARTTAGTLTIEDTPEGLRCSPTVDLRQQVANDLVIAIERGDVNQMSVGFVCDRDQWNDARDERTVTHFKAMPDLSAVTYPASPSTSIEVARRSLATLPPEPLARIRRLVVDVRAGKMMSQKNQDKLVAAIGTMHDALASAGVDLSAIDPDHDGDVDGLEVDADDGTVDDDTGTERADDFTGLRPDEDPGEGIRADESQVEQPGAEAPAEPSERLLQLRAAFRESERRAVLRRRA